MGLPVSSLVCSALAMEGRCTVVTLAEFGCPSSTSYTAKVMCIGTNVVLYAGSDEVQVFNNQDRKLTASFLSREMDRNI